MDSAFSHGRPGISPYVGQRGCRTRKSEDPKANPGVVVVVVVVAVVVVVVVGYILPCPLPNFLPLVGHGGIRQNVPVPQTLRGQKKGTDDKR